MSAASAGALAAVPSSVKLAMTIRIGARRFECGTHRIGSCILARSCGCSSMKTRSQKISGYGSPSTSAPGEKETGTTTTSSAWTRSTESFG